MRPRTALSYLAAIAAALIGAASAMAAPNADNCATDGAQGCVMMLEVDGLEAQDVTSETTPFLWALAHPGQPADPTSPTLGAALQGRSGFIWQAARGVMTAGTAPAAVALLTGAEPTESRIPADEFFPTEKPDDGGTTWLEFPATTTAAGDFREIDSETLNSTTLLDLAKAEDTRGIAAFVGSPYVARLMPDGEDGYPHYWPDANDRGDPALCPVPRRADQPPSPDTVCPTNDAKTLSAAYQGIKGLTGHGPQVVYIHLAELGAIKRHSGDPDRASGGDVDETISKALTNLDSAIAAFVSAYANDPDTQPLWQKTALVLVGNHGYELTPVANRVPYPGRAQDASYDLAEFVDDTSLGKARLVPQGTIGTIYWPDATPENLAALADSITGSVNAACSSPCIQEVLAVEALEAHPENYPETVAAKHPTWRLDPIDGLTGLRTGAGGDLVVVTEPGWALGRAVSGTASDPLIASDDPRTEITNPYEGSSGGPRNRAVAALVSGPSGVVTQVVGTYAGGPESPETLDSSCLGSANNSNPPAQAPVEQVNVDAHGDDAGMPGYTCQLETIDVAPSLAAFLKLSLPAEQLGDRVRFLEEAFVQALAPTVEFEELGEVFEEAPPPDPPPPPPPTVIIPAPPVLEIFAPPPPPPPAYDFEGLVRNLQARVIDGVGNGYADSPPGARMTTIEIKGEFGRPGSAVTLTFYSDKPKPKAKTTKTRSKSKSKPKGRASAAPRRIRLRALAKFKPFTIHRGPAKLKLRIPTRFRPTHIGVTVQELADAKDESATGTTLLGPLTGAIIAIDDAPFLHRIKPNPAAPPAKRRPRR